MHLLAPVSRPAFTQFTSTGAFGAFVISPVLSETLRDPDGDQRHDLLRLPV